MDNDADWVHYLRNLYQILQIRFSECAHLVSMSIKGLRNISTIGLFMNIYKVYILILDEEPCKIEVLK